MFQRVGAELQARLQSERKVFGDVAVVLGGLSSWVPPLPKKYRSLSVAGFSWSWEPAAEHRRTDQNC